jgi:hypothetical protein
MRRPLLALALLTAALGCVKDEACRDGTVLVNFDFVDGPERVDGVALRYRLDDGAEIDLAPVARPAGASRGSLELKVTSYGAHHLLVLLYAPRKGTQQVGAWTEVKIPLAEGCTAIDVSVALGFVDGTAEGGAAEVARPVVEVQPVEARDGADAVLGIDTAAAVTDAQDVPLGPIASAADAPATVADLVADPVAPTPVDSAIDEAIEVAAMDTQADRAAVPDAGLSGDTPGSQESTDADAAAGAGGASGTGGQTGSTTKPGTGGANGSGGSSATSDTTGSGGVSGVGGATSMGGSGGTGGSSCTANTSADPNNCGGCGVVCPDANHAHRLCADGKCTIECDTSMYFDCNGRADDGCEVDLVHDNTNCGACGNVCPVTETADGRCGYTDKAAQHIGCPGCNVGSTPANYYANCDLISSNGCETITWNDNNNCGACRNVCPSGTHCLNANCVSL